VHPDQQSRFDTAVIGAGWAGLAACVRLVEAGHRVVLLDAAPQAGGRARSLPIEMAGSRLLLDNGQHLLMGAYGSVLSLLQRIGVDSQTHLQRDRLNLLSVDGLRMQAGPLPGRLSLASALLTARGLPWAHRLSMAQLLLRLPADLDTLWPHGLTVSDWLNQARQPAGLIETLWRPLCVGALNTELDQACARTFARVLRDTLLAGDRASDMILPLASLGEMLPDPALTWLKSQGACIQLRTACRGLHRDGQEDGWTIMTDRGQWIARHVVLAVSPHNAARLIPADADPRTLSQLNAFQYESIASVWLAWREPLALPRAILLHEDFAAAQPGQWLFDRSHASVGTIKSAAGVVVSAAGQALPSPSVLAAQVADQVCTQMALPRPDAARSIIERQATVRCTPDRPRLSADSLSNSCPQLALAGDWVWHDYPSTLESAVRSGDAAASWIVSQASAAG